MSDALHQSLAVPAPFCGMWLNRSIVLSVPGKGDDRPAHDGRRGKPAADQRLKLNGLVCAGVLDERCKA